MSSEMRECPFCGNGAWVVRVPDTRRFRPQCKKCGADLGEFDREADAVAAWNRRALLARTEAAPVADGELPGMWSASDFTGGDPDERCHAERTQVACRGYAKLGIGAYLIEHSAESEPAALMLCIASEEEKAGRTVGDLKTFEGERQPIPAEKMVVRIDFANVAGLDALEQQLRILREVHFPATHPQDASGDAVTGRVNGYMFSARAIEIITHGEVPEWITKAPGLRVTITAMQANGGGE